MKVLVITSLLLLVIVNSVDSAQPARRSDSSVALILTQKPKRQIDYRLSSDVDESSQELNMKLLDLLSKKNIDKYFNNAETKNSKRNAIPCTSSLESDESDGGNKEDKKSCYKNTYKNVLNAFEEALKSQIHDYKRCVCQKKRATTTTTTTTEEPNSPSEEKDGAAPLELSEEREGDPKNNLYGKASPSVQSSEDDPDGYYCFHKQHLKMIKELLHLIPCPRVDLQAPADMEEFNDEDGNTRNERHNKHSEESFELDATTIQRTSSPKVNEDEQLRDLILSVLKEHMRARNAHEETTTSTTPANLVKSLDNLNHEEFIEKLKKLFQEIESAEQSFPVRSHRLDNEKTSPVSSRKSSKKSKKSTHTSETTIQHRSRNEIPCRTTVIEASDESTETIIKPKNGKSSKQHVKSKEYVPLPKSSVDKQRSSYRTAPRANHPRTHHSTHQHAAKETSKVTKTSSTLNDDRIANDLAKAISDLARKYIKNSI